MKIKEVPFIGFSHGDIKKIRAEMKRQRVSGEEEFFLSFTQLVADAVGCDAGTVIQPGGIMAVVKIGECERRNNHGNR